MRLLFNRNVIRWIIVVSSFIIISLILWNTYVFFQHFNSEERTKMKSWTKAYTEYVNEFANSGDDLEKDLEINEVVQYIVLDTTITTPMLLVDADRNIVRHRNIKAKPRLKENNELARIYNDSIDERYVKLNKEKLILKFQKENTPLIMEDLNQTLYYGNSPLLSKLKYYPLALLLIILLFAGVVYFFYRSSKIAQQNNLVQYNK